MYTLGAAAKATGKSKATISKALKSGRVSGHKGDDGVFHIDPSELHRVYPPITPSERKETLENDSKVRELETRLEVAQQRLTDKDEIIDDLREDRNRWRQQATSLLENKQEKGLLRKLLNR